MDAEEVISPPPPEIAVSTAPQPLPKLIALKKAYADIILNISKEAAARVMSSERRAARYQHELKVAKEEGLRMLLRLKQMMDYRTSEAEAAALNQQKKIEELEAQLEEAEDIVKDLREELGEKQAEMERIKKENLQNVNEIRHEFAMASDVTIPLQNDSCPSKRDCMCGSYIGNQELPSIILRNKEPGLYRNGCTQRIRACERNVLDKESSPSGETDKLKDKNNSEEQPEVEDTSKSPSPVDKILSEVESKLLGDVKLSSFPPVNWKRKRATRRRKTVTAFCRKETDLSKKLDQLPESNNSSENNSKIELMLSPGKAETCVESSGGSALQKDEELKEKMEPLREETEFAVSLESTVHKVDIENCDIPSNGVEANLSDATKELSSEPVRERVIKYTFQRKRKRGVPIVSEVNAPPEKEEGTGEKENGHENVEPSKCSLLVESSRDSRRLAQVARQLISLSEKKWWH